MSTSVSILGNVGKEVELRYTADGTAVAKFSMASDSVRSTKDGQIKTTDWFNVTAFGKLAETLAQNLRKGSQVLVLGSLSLDAYVSRDGEPRVSADVRLRDFQFAGSFEPGGAGEPQTNGTPEEAEPFADQF